MKVKSAREFLESVLLVTIGMPKYDEESINLYDQLITKALDYFDKEYLKLGPTQFLQTFTEKNVETLSESTTAYVEGNQILDENEIERVSKLTVARAALYKLTNGKLNVSLKTLDKIAE